MRKEAKEERYKKLNQGETAKITISEGVLPAMMGDDILLRARVGGRAVGESRKWRREEKFGRKMRNCESLSLLRSPTHRSSLLR